VPIRHARVLIGKSAALAVMQNDEIRRGTMIEGRLRQR
jgi:hypothetical protein